MMMSDFIEAMQILFWLCMTGIAGVIAIMASIAFVAWAIKPLMDLTIAQFNRKDENERSCEN